MIHHPHPPTPATSNRQLLGQIGNSNSGSASLSFAETTTASALSSSCEIINNSSTSNVVDVQPHSGHSAHSGLIKNIQHFSSSNSASMAPVTTTPIVDDEHQISVKVVAIDNQIHQSRTNAPGGKYDNSSTNTSDHGVVYGELVILGYNGCLPQGEKGRRRSKYQLIRRSRPNGIKKSKHYSVKQPQTSKAIQDKDQHSISFTLSRSQAIIVEYQHDDDTDMFQIGRSSESPIDFVVIDTMVMDQHNHQRNQHHQHNYHHNAMIENGSFMVSSPPPPPPAITTTKVVQQSTISRFACRILVDRKPPHCARIYAAGFDSSKNIFLGEKATKWQTNGEIDGLTTNGILIMHPKQPFISRMTTAINGDVDLVNQHSSSSSTYQYTVGSSGIWREVSVCGEIYSVRETRSASQKGVRIENETNVLQDGTLIDLCGATLMWRSCDGLMRSPTKRHLEEMIDQLNASRPQCPVGLNTLVIPRKSASLGSTDDKQPYVYLKCGHVQGYHDWGQNKHSNSRTCPMCFKSGPIVKLTMGIEPSFCTSSGAPNYCFNPCGHMASESTVKYWCQVLIPHGTNGFHAMCPFCGTPLQGEIGYVKLIFQ